MPLVDGVATDAWVFGEDSPRARRTLIRMKPSASSSISDHHPIAVLRQ